MLRLSIKICAVFPAAALAQIPAPSIPLARGEVLLQLQANGRVMKSADRVALSCIVTGKGKTVADARAALPKERDKLAAALAKSGVTPISLSLLPSWQATPGLLRGLADLASMAGSAAASDTTEEETPPKTESTMIRLVLPSVDQITVAKDTIAGNGCAGTVSVETELADGEPARSEAKSQALAKASAEASSYATQLNLRVVRIARVSEASAGLLDMLGPEYKNMMATMSSALAGSRNETPGQIATEVTLAVDYILAPK